MQLVEQELPTLWSDWVTSRF